MFMATPRPSSSLCGLIVGCALVFSTILTAASEKRPVPNKTAQDESLALIRDIYREEWASAKTPLQKMRLAKKLFEAGLQTADDPVSRYVLFRVAQDIAVTNGDASFSLMVIDEMHQNYEVDAIDMRLGSIQTLSKSASSTVNKALANAAFAVAEEAIVADRYESAEEAAEVSIICAKKAKDVELGRKATNRHKLIQSLKKNFSEIQAALNVLETKPVDPDANLSVGRFQCFVKGDWEIGLPMLALGSDKELQRLAIADLKVDEPVGTVEGYIKLADEWWSLAENSPEEFQTNIKLRAAYFYEKTNSQVSGITKARSEKRVKEMAKAREDIITAVATPRASINKALPGNQNPVMAQPRTGETREFTGLKIKFVYCELGTFLMGSPLDQKERQHDEAAVEVTLAEGFWLGQTEVTQKQWVDLMGTRPWRKQDGSLQLKIIEGDDFAASYITYADAVEFCEKLTALERRAGHLPANASYMLPTEAQWEYACRAGTKTRFSYGDDDRQMEDHAWLTADIIRVGNAFALPRVGQKKANPWGFYDMYGNVLEWCRDSYRERLPGGRDPYVQGGTKFVIRGDLRGSSRRHNSIPSYSHHNLGFRLARIEPAGTAMTEPKDSVVSILGNWVPVFAESRVRVIPVPKPKEPNWRLQLDDKGNINEFIPGGALARSGRWSGDDKRGYVAVFPQSEHGDHEWRLIIKDGVLHRHSLYNGRTEHVVYRKSQ